MTVTQTAAAQVNSDLFATCAQVSIAAVIVIGIDAAAMHVAAQAISGGNPAVSIHDRLDAWRRAVQKWMTAVLSATSSIGDDGSFASFDARLRYNPYLIRIINLFLVAGLLLAAAMPIVALVSAILGLWLQARQLEGLVATTTVLSVIFVALLLFLQIRMRATESAQQATAAAGLDDAVPAAPQAMAPSGAPKINYRYTPAVAAAAIAALALISRLRNRR